MADPEIADKKPAVIELERGAHYWCACGRSKNQPFCDGSHEGTEFHPYEIIVTEEKRRVALCQCKRTAKAPLCDGTHAKLS